MTGWHAPDDLVIRYADDALPEPDAWSLEKHLEECGGCATRVSRAVRETAAGAVLAQVRTAVLAAAPVPVPARRVSNARLWSSRVLLPSSRPRPARMLWVAGPAVRGAWPAAVLLVALGAVALAHLGGFDGTRPLLLAVAPVVPVAGVALSYGAHADPLHEIVTATPSGGLRLVLTRTAAVLAVSLPLLTLAGLLLPGSGAPGAAAWLLPGLALTSASLALGSYVGCRTATAVIAGGWLCAVPARALAAPGGHPTARLAEELSRCLDGAPAQGAWAAAAALCAALLAARRTTFDHGEQR